MARMKFTTDSKNRLSDRDMVFDLLVTEKYMSQMYNQGILEASNARIRNLFEQLGHDEHENARLLFNTMQQKGWYKTDRENLGSPRRNNQQFNYTADSNYAVSSGTQGFGRRLSTRKRTSPAKMERAPMDYDDRYQSSHRFTDYPQ